jgi:hypothetical protein
LEWKVVWGDCGGEKVPLDADMPFIWLEVGLGDIMLGCGACWMMVALVGVLMVMED